MKKFKLAVTTFLLCSVYQLTGQNTERFFRLQTDIDLQECKRDGSFDSTMTFQRVPGDSKFTLVGSVGDNNIIQFWNWDASSFYELAAKKDSGEAFTKKEEGQYEDAMLYFRLNINPITLATRYFLIPKDMMEWNTLPIIETWNPVLGGAVLPFKFRFKPVDFSANFSLATLGGVRYSFRGGRLSLGLVAGAGLTTVQLDKLNTKGGVTEVSDRSASFVSGGLVVQFERAQAVVLCGADWVATRERKGWIYQGQPWISFGVGLAIFTEDRSPKEASGQNKK